MDLKAFEKGVSYESTCWAGYRGRITLNTDGLLTEEREKYIQNSADACEKCRLWLDFYCDGINLSGTARVDAIRSNAFELLQTRKALCLDQNKG